MLSDGIGSYASPLALDHTRCTGQTACGNPCRPDPPARFISMLPWPKRSAYLHCQFSWLDYWRLRRSGGQQLKDRSLACPSLYCALQSCPLSGLPSYVAFQLPTLPPFPWPSCRAGSTAAADQQSHQAGPAWRAHSPCTVSPGCWQLIAVRALWAAISA